MFASNSPAFTPETLTIHRLVQKLSAQVTSDLDSWQSDPRFHHSVKTLLDLVDGAEHTLSATAHHQDAAHSRLQEYKLEARRIRDMLNVAAQPSYIDPCRDSGDLIDAEASAYSAAQERAFSALRSPVGPNTILQNAQGLGKDAQRRLASHEGIQEDLTDQMVSLASKLKQQAQAQSAALHQREAALDSASQGLLKSVQGVQAVVKDTKQAVKRTHRSMFFSFFVLVTVAAVFLGVYGFINVTAMMKLFVPYKTMASQWASKKPRPARSVPQGAERVSQARADPDAAGNISNLEVDLTSDAADAVITEPADTHLDNGEELSRSQGLGTPVTGDGSENVDSQEDSGADTPEPDDRYGMNTSEEQSAEEALYLPEEEHEDEEEEEDEDDNGSGDEQDGDDENMEPQEDGQIVFEVDDTDSGIVESSDAPDAASLNKPDIVGVDSPTLSADTVSAEEEADIPRSDDEQAPSAPPGISEDMDVLQPSSDLDGSAQPDMKESKDCGQAPEGKSQSDGVSGDDEKVTAHAKCAIHEQPGTEAAAAAQKTPSAEPSDSSSDTGAPVVPKVTPGDAPAAAFNAKPSKSPEVLANAELNAAPHAAADTAADMSSYAASETQPEGTSQTAPEEGLDSQSTSAQGTDVAADKAPDVPVEAAPATPLEASPADPDEEPNVQSRATPDAAVTADTAPASDAAEAASDGRPDQNPGLASDTCATEAGIPAGEAQKASPTEAPERAGSPPASGDSGAFDKAAHVTALNVSEDSATAPAEADHTDSGHGDKAEGESAEPDEEAEEDVYDDKADGDDSEEVEQPAEAQEKDGAADTAGEQTGPVDEEEDEYYDDNDTDDPAGSGTDEKGEEDDEYEDEPGDPEDPAHEDVDETEDEDEAEDEDEEEEEEEEMGGQEANRQDEAAGTEFGDADGQCDRPYSSQSCGSDETAVNPKHVRVVRQAREWAANPELSAMDGLQDTESNDRMNAKASKGVGSEDSGGSASDQAPGPRNDF